MMIEENRPSSGQPALLKQTFLATADAATALVAKTPVRMAPRVPPAPWTPKASSASS